MVRGIRLHPMVANDNGHGTAAFRFLMDHLQFGSRGVEAGDLIQTALDGADEDGTAVAQDAWLVGSLVAR